MSIIVGFTNASNFICRGLKLFRSTISTSGGKGISIVRIENTPIIPKHNRINPNFMFCFFIYSARKDF
ncbi:hypothetical protein CG08_0336 [Riemerella anatipestifer]|uniref:Uncharacterized protein n=1 Tax=Riemerella anatipestifer (strain ATCC 11845 / DSM 15868 / JCM 9532 / NCTC 11014) TaxID=693978 RepID=H8MDE8_RIEAD|nr:hypothetical protein RIA_1974 [Riemerella anatipestifer RA-GD]AFD55497.1 hypothetical protein RA0C_0520 [Riemerella anatipestifer ATCC 11845 = DSM 15868]AGC40621.1 hypothetical protein G148_1317 [Riemerella anatipestifer RA-CH-2]AKP68758.1 hypothetical protein CG08_0336 [Riemerella anatipestifer]EFT35818.1 hypothetical protein RAYM_02917 [Riemerella anatipestifer RA-YM]